LPLLEAMACGVPVIASNNSSIPEIVGDAALLFDAQDVSGMFAVISKVLSDDSLQTSLSKKGIEHTASFSWEKCAYQTLYVYKQTLQNANRKVFGKP
jgi:alpha-1,3-rhamnosyl/mannosyltransferase